jgi:hypothetical protein
VVSPDDFEKARQVREALADVANHAIANNNRMAGAHLREFVVFASDELLLKLCRLIR